MVAKIVVILVVAFAIVSMVNAQQQECGANEEHQTCGSACAPVCGEPQRNFCTANCVSGCFCKSGYIRSNDKTSCIPKSDCKN